MPEPALQKTIKTCTICKKYLTYKPKPVLNFSLQSRVMIVLQAPGTKVHKTGVPWNDPSGVRLRQWLGVTSDQFYDTRVFGIVPMGFCYPGRGKSGDLPPRPECSATWMEPILKILKKRELTILIGKYAQHYFLKDRKKLTLTDTVKTWELYLPKFVVLPHPSPRNNIWLKKNPWFEKNLLPNLKTLIRNYLT